MKSWVFQIYLSMLKRYLMAKRRFKLPGIQDLTKDQDKVLRLPQDGQFLVVGGPGTGKSVVALLRTLQFQQDNNYRFLTFNHVLNSATNQWVEVPLVSDTIHSWFYSLQYSLTKQYMPEIKSHSPDYDEVVKRLDTLNSSPNNEHLIIDEGQDVPPGFYDSLMCLGYENFFILADQNQQITEEHSSREELTDLLGLDVDDVIELVDNHRNTAPIANFCQTFYTDKSSPPPTIPNRPSLDTPILYEYKLVKSCVEMILREADRDDSKLIGLIVATNVKRDDYVKQLNKVEISRDNEKPIVSSYSNEDKQSVNIDFSQGGIVVLNSQSVKGIEFDSVFIVIDGFKLYNNDVTDVKKQFYVMTSRAREKLILFQSELYRDGVDSIFTNDASILMRGNI